ncbi:aminopeptidase [Mucilaginibacter sp. PAMC 26640]|nr:aminopeptidase [Mucilaginibacter sp. PAMC 26640]
MNLKTKISFVFCIVCLAIKAQPSPKTLPVETGVALQLATYRHQVISDIQYTLNFAIPAKKADAVTASEVIEFNLSAIGQPLQIDFKQAAINVQALAVNGKAVTVELQKEHLIIDPKSLRTGVNKIAIRFIAGSESLNRNDDYMYCLFVPDHARNTFPCFDQPDLKARFLLTLSVPTGWQVMANGQQKGSKIEGDKTVYEFANSDKLPTYLFSFTAGKYTYASQQLNARSAEFLYRETDQKKIELSLDSVFIAHQNAISFLQEWTGIAYPFQKVGFVAIPDFQFGGMEHPGEVQYKASALFLDDGATKDQFISRANLISHETAHMWFGDLVTMQWFNDVWMKEVFANFMADKVTQKMMGEETFNLKFLQDHYPAAYNVDRTAGANPIRQPLDNLQEAGSLYGDIIYNKAPIMMRQLEQLMGQENFQMGIRQYLKKYAYGNATWTDLIAILSKHTTADLYRWNKVWVNEPGRPVFDYSIAYNGSKIRSLVISQHPESGTQRIWPQAFSITLFYPSGIKTIPVDMNAQQISLKAAIGMDRPLYMLFNSDGMGYGLFPSDKSIKLYNLKSPLQRAAAYISAYENMLAGRSYQPVELLSMFTDGLTAETNEMNLRLINGYISTIYWEFLSQQVRQGLSLALETSVWDALQKQTAVNNKKILFRTYQSVFTSKDAVAKMHRIWQDQQPPEGIKLNEDDYTGIALSLALRGDSPRETLKQQEERITNADRKIRLQFLAPALSPEAAERDAFFKGLSGRKNRAKEAWVGAALAYLNHPLRQSTSVKYLPQSLQLLGEIQQTGDIFFPQSWLGAIFGSYQSKEAADDVQVFLNNHPAYNPRLKAKILQATDNLMRAQNLVPQP